MTVTIGYLEKEEISVISNKEHVQIMYLHKWRLLYIKSIMDIEFKNLYMEQLYVRNSK